MQKENSAAVSNSESKEAAPVRSWCVIKSLSGDTTQQVPSLICTVSLLSWNPHDLPGDSRIHMLSTKTPPVASAIWLQIRSLKTSIAALHGWTCWLPLLHWQTVHSSSLCYSIERKDFLFFPSFPLDCCCSLLLLCLTVTEITAGGAVLLHQLTLAVAIAFPSPSRTDK